MGTRATTGRPWSEFDDCDYYFGQGVLRITVTRPNLGYVTGADGDRFVQVEGLEYCWNGAPMGLRRVYIRASALAAAGNVPA